MPLYEYECIACRQSVEDSLKKLREKINSEIVSDLVEKYDNIYFIEVADLNKKKVLAKHR
ncbi:MAG: hypothetical protein HYW01_09185 [Deltaproteobacteria bacterium]|nr:hypothetical protein [Deltaproteobacteria bacterium]